MNENKKHILSEIHKVVCVFPFFKKLNNHFNYQTCPPSNSYEIYKASPSGSSSEAAEDNAFKRSATLEAILNTIGKVIAYEVLCHPVGETTGKIYSISEASKKAYKAGDHYKFDLMTCSLGIKKAKETGMVPITLNISPTSALNPKFIGEVIKRINREGLCSEDIIFELLEHVVDPKADIEHLNKFKKRGYRFALDDFGLSKDHDNRLSLFGELVDFIKIDGPVLRGYLCTELDVFNNEEPMNGHEYKSGDLNKILEKIKVYFEERSLEPPMLIAERVHKENEIKLLAKLGIENFQSRNSPINKAIQAPERQQALANGELACEYA